MHEAKTMLDGDKTPKNAVDAMLEEDDKNERKFINDRNNKVWILVGLGARKPFAICKCM